MAEERSVKKIKMLNPKGPNGQLKHSKLQCRTREITHQTNAHTLPCVLSTVDHFCFVRLIKKAGERVDDLLVMVIVCLLPIAWDASIPGHFIC